MEACINKPGGTDMSKFRRGLGCVLESYGVVNNHRVSEEQLNLLFYYNISCWAR